MPKSRLSLRDTVIKEQNAVREARRLGADPAGIERMKRKMKFRLVRLVGIRPVMANIIKETMLSAGGDTAVHKLACACKVEKTDVLLMGTLAQYGHLLNNLKYQPYGGKDIHRRLKKLID